MDSDYSFRGEATDKLPVFTDITVRNVRIIGPGKITLDGFDASHRLGMRFDNLVLDDPKSVSISAGHGEFALGPGPVNFLPAGEDTKITGVPGKGTPNACEGKFVKYQLVFRHISAVANRPRTNSVGRAVGVPV